MASSESEWADSDTPRERWAPLGAVADSPPAASTEHIKSGGGTVADASCSLHSLLQENEKMSSSLLSLTSHFAQVQFRLKQIIEGPEESKHERLKELDEFAERGIPDIKSVVLPNSGDATNEQSDEEFRKKLSDQQKAMICELKNSLADLESYAYENGLAEELPTTKKMEKQDVVIEQMRSKLHITDLDNLATLSSSELRECVDEAISQIVNPAKVKEKQVEQLRTQVGDLERFVDFLQVEVTEAQNEARRRPSTHTQPTHISPSRSPHLDPQYYADTVRTQGTGSSEKSDPPHDEGLTARLKRVIRVLHLYLISELGCGSRQTDVRRNEMKFRDSEPHYGDLLAEVQMAVDVLIDMAEQVKHERDNSMFTDCDYFSDDESYVSESKELTKCVRKEFAMALKSLIEHGALERQSSRAVIPFVGCASKNSVTIKTEAVHAWTIILSYYHLKDGHKYNQAPLQKLANAFGIGDTRTAPPTVKQSLLCAIGQVIETHTPYQRSQDAHFKAFICLALNEKRLVAWMRQIFRTTALIEKYYEPWSYVAKTGFEDVFCTMNKLRLYDFQLPVDLAIRQFNDIKDAF